MPDIFSSAPAAMPQFEKPGFLTQIADIFATPQRAVVGAVDAAMSGGDLGGSISNAIAARRSFTNIFEEQGVDPRAAGVLGFGADVLSDPLNLVPFGAAGHLIGQGGREVGSIASKAILAAGVLPRTAKEVLAAAPMLTEQAAQTGMRSSAARGAFRLHIPEGMAREQAGEMVFERAKAEARKAAHFAGVPKSEIARDPNVMATFAQGLLKRAIDKDPVRSSRIVDETKSIWRMWVSSLDKSLRTDAAAFTDQGANIADLLKHSENVADVLSGERESFFKRSIMPLLKTEEEQINWFRVGAGKEVKALNANVEEAVARWRQFDDMLFQDARDAGIRQIVPKTHSLGQQELFPDVAEAARQMAKEEATGYDIVPIQHRQNHMPFYYKKEAVAALFRNGPEREAALTKLVENGFADNKQSATAVLDSMLHADDGFYVPAEFRGGPMQFSRELLLDIPVEEDPRKWFPKYNYVTSKRIAQAGIFGPQDEKLRSWLTAVREQGGDVERAENIYRNIIGRPLKKMTRGASLASNIGAFQTITGLGPRTTLLQFMQLANSAAQHGIMNTFRGFGALLQSPETRQLAHEVGALLPSEHMTFEGGAATSASTWYLENITRMPEADRAVRTTSGAAGMLAAKRWGKMLMTQSVAGRSLAERGLRRLGVDPSAVLQQGGELTLDQFRTAFQQGSHTTQFASHLSDMPEAWRSPFGRFFYKFRAFAKQQSTFVTYLVDEAVRYHNPKPMMRYIAASAVLYSAAKPALDFLAGRHKPAEEEQAIDYLKGLLFTGALGATGDFFTNATANDKQRVLGMFTGPAVSQAAGIVSDIGSLLGGNAHPITKSIRRTLETPVLRPLELLGQ